MKHKYRKESPKPAEPAPQPPKKTKWWQIVLAFLLSQVLLLVLIVAVWWSIAGVKSFGDGMQLVKNLFGGKKEDSSMNAPTAPAEGEYVGISYSGTDEAAAKNRSQVVATIGEHQLTNGVLQVYYWLSVYDFLDNYGYSAIYMGLDYTKPLDKQKYSDEVGSWQQLFLEESLKGWQAYQAMAILGQKEGIALSEDMQSSLDGLRKKLTDAATEAGFSSVDAMLQAEMGAGVTFDDYYQYTKTYYEGYMYYSTMYDKIDTSAEALEAYFSANETALKQEGITKDSGNNFDIRHILIGIEGGTKGEDGKIVYSDEEWEACREKAQKLLDEWLAGEHTEDTFAELAKNHSTDDGSKDNGGLYTKLDKDTKFVEEFVNWYMDKDRKVGDYGLIKTEYGYHIMYCSGIEAKWETACEQGVLAEAYEEILEAAVEEYPMEVDYKKIILGVVNLGA